MPLRSEWVDAGREPQCDPNPAYPLGIDIDASGGAAAACKMALPYPAKRCGMHVITCSDCGATAGCTTAGRIDDPRSIKIACHAERAVKH
jgi:hypothetical protein